MSKKLTYRRFLDIAEYPVGDAWKILQPYLADEQPEPTTKPEPSRLEVAAILANGLGYKYGHAKEYLDMADELIKESRL